MTGRLRSSASPPTSASGPTTTGRTREGWIARRPCCASWAWSSGSRPTIWALGESGILDLPGPALARTPADGIADAVLDRVIVDKNARIGDGARLVNEQNVEHVDGAGYYIRSGIIVVPKGGVIRPGTVV